MSPQWLQSKYSSRLIPWVVILFVVALGSVVGVAIFGLVRGEEFSPRGFGRRSFVYYQIPLLELQVTPVVRTPVTCVMCQKLKDAKYLEPTSAEEADRWDMVFRATIGRSNVDGAARQLCLYLDARTDSGKSVWQSWTDQHPKLATVLWPRVIAMAREKLYFAIPEMMRIASHTDDASLLAQQLDTEMAQARLVVPNVSQFPIASPRSR